MGKEKTQWKKGQSGNPSGQPKIPEDIKAMRKLTAIEFERAVNRYLFEDRSVVAKAAADPNTPVIELLITSILHKAVSQGDEKRLGFFLDRLLGRVANRIEFDPETLKRIEDAEKLKAMPTEQLKALVHRAMTAQAKEDKESDEPDPRQPPDTTG